MDYEKFFGLNDQAFKLNYEAKFFYQSAQINKIFKVLKSGQRASISFINGPRFVGKTFFLRRLYSEFTSEVKPIVICNPNLTLEEFLREALSAFGLNYKVDTQTPEEVMLGLLQNAISDFISEGSKIVLAIDEAQNLSLEKIEDFISLAKLEPHWVGNFDLIFVGDHLENIKLDDSLKVQFFKLNYFTRAEVARYVDFRLKVAGAKKNFFQGAALDVLYKYSGGEAKQINELAEKSLMAAWAEGRKEVQASHVEFAKNSLDNPLKINKNLDQVSKSQPHREKTKKARNWKAQQRKGFKIKKIIPILFLLLVVVGLYFLFGGFKNEVELVGHETPLPLTDPKVEIQETQTLSPPADTSNLTEQEALWATLPSPPEHLLKLPFSSFILIIDAETGISHLWQMGTKGVGLKAEIYVPGFETPGLYLIGKPEKNIPLVFQYPPLKELPNKAVLDLWPQVGNLMPQNTLAVMVAPKKNLVKKLDDDFKKVFEDKVQAWVEAQEYKFSDTVASLYANNFQFFELGKTPKALKKEDYKQALTNEFLSSGDISIIISEPLLIMDPNRNDLVWAVFHLKYESDLRHDMGIRILVFEKKILAADSWLITAELWLQEASLR